MRVVVHNWLDDAPNGGLWSELDARLVTRQMHLNPMRVRQKANAGDFNVQVSPRFLRRGEACRRVLDGHHSLEAARQTGATPVLQERSPSNYTLYNEGPLVDAVTRCSV